MDQRIEYSEDRREWDLFVNYGYGWEWYYQGTLEECEKAMFNNAACWAEEEG